jgi:DNA-binding transcriptional ArsR family regulator
MVFDTAASEQPTFEDVIEALDDDQCLKLLYALDEPRSVKALSEAADVPLSTTYRKISKLEGASLVEERTEIRDGGHHRTTYTLDADRVVVDLVGGPPLSVDIVRPPEPEGKLVEMWSEVRSET